MSDILKAKNVENYYSSNSVGKEIEKFVWLLTTVSHLLPKTLPRIAQIDTDSFGNKNPTRRVGAASC